MDNTVVDGLHHALADLQSTLDRIKEGCNSLDDVGKDLPHVERIKLLSTMAYSLASLYWISLRVSGSNISAHPIKQELDRVKVYMLKVQKLSDPTADRYGPTSVIDKDAASRIVKEALSSNK